MRGWIPAFVCQDDGRFRNADFVTLNPQSEFCNPRFLTVDLAIDVRVLRWQLAHGHPLPFR